MNGLLEVFYDDHEHALAQLNQLEKYLEYIKKNGEAEKVRIQLISFSKFLEIALDIHFVQEEEALFPLLVQKIGPNGPVMVMEMEHGDLRESQKALKALLTKEELDKEAILEHGGRILSVLREHIAKENQVLFPLSERVLTEEEWKQAEKIAGEIALGQKLA
ncbi:hemerythrin domain-containing protein [Tepidibacillus fermentans]|uniref:Hemerythrin-like domain-containing protein n=1 Tax=Tepidibacillus fermentans TaxID=1281767 RepID=A0A4R3KH84_9BACI|nr:hemerythrin domain-containing protein [Tepidibacillus fermentans]TCS82493.1 hemerythrin-like domain-containing protein [Tepidibacillus fermentans]